MKKGDKNTKYSHAILWLKEGITKSQPLKMRMGSGLQTKTPLRRRRRCISKLFTVGKVIKKISLAPLKGCVLSLAKIIEAEFTDEEIEF